MGFVPLSRFPSSVSQVIDRWYTALVAAVNSLLMGIQTGEGDPEGSVVAPQGTLYRRTDGSTTTTLYVKTSGGVVQPFTDTGWTTGSAGDMVGPASSVDETIVRFDGTTGKLIQGYTSGGPTVSDTGSVTVGTVWNTPTETKLDVESTYTNSTYGVIGEEVRVAVQAQGSGDYTTGRVGFSSIMADTDTATAKAITGAANNGSGLIRITAVGHTIPNGERVNVYAVGGTTEANGSWVISVIDANTFDLVGSTFTNAYTSGGAVTDVGLLYCFRGFIQPKVGRSSQYTGTGSNGGDTCILAGQNIGTAKGTEAIYIAQGNAGVNWYAVFSSTAEADYGLLLTGENPAASSETSAAAACAALWPPYTANTSTTDTRRTLSVRPTLNFGGSNANKTLNVVEIDTVNTSTTGCTTNLLNAAYGGSDRATLRSDGLLTVKNQTDLYIQSSNYTNGTGGGGLKLAKYRGTIDAPLRVQSGDVVGSIAVIGGFAVDNTTAAGTTSNTANLRFVALESFTSTAVGTKFELRTVPVGSTTLATRLIVDEGGAHIGQTTAARSTTQGTNQLEIYDGTAPVGTLTNGCSFYSTAGEMRVMDAAGNATLLSPHDKATNEWIFDSVTVSGKRLRIDVERMLRALDRQLGGGYIHEEGV